MNRNVRKIASNSNNEKRKISKIQSVKGSKEAKEAKQENLEKSISNLKKVLNESLGAQGIEHMYRNQPDDIDPSTIIERDELEDTVPIRPPKPRRVNFEIRPAKLNVIQEEKGEITKDFTGIEHSTPLSTQKGKNITGFRNNIELEERSPILAPEVTLGSIKKKLETD